MCVAEAAHAAENDNTLSTEAQQTNTQICSLRSLEARRVSVHVCVGREGHALLQYENEVA